MQVLHHIGGGPLRPFGSARVLALLKPMTDSVYGVYWVQPRVVRTLTRRLLGCFLRTLLHAKIADLLDPVSNASVMYTYTVQ